MTPTAIMTPTMTNRYLIYATLAMALVTFIIRAIPALIPSRYLDTPWLHRLNERLPLTVLVLLIVTSLSYQGILADWQLVTDHDNVPMLLAQLAAITIVLVVYHFSRQLLISMIAGIAVLNALLWWLT